MTKIVFFRKGKNLCGFEASEHSGFAQEGEDIVCSGISALTQTAVLGLSEHLKLDIEAIIEDGHIYCALKSKPTCETDAILETLLLGLRSIANNYKDYLNITEREV